MKWRKILIRPLIHFLSKIKSLTGQKFPFNSIYSKSIILRHLPLHVDLSIFYSSGSTSMFSSDMYLWTRLFIFYVKSSDGVTILPLNLSFYSSSSFRKLWKLKFFYVTTAESPRSSSNLLYLWSTLREYLLLSFAYDVGFLIYWRNS